LKCLVIAMSELNPSPTITLYHQTLIMKQIILSLILLFIAASIKCQSTRPEVSFYTIYKREITSHFTGRSEYYNLHGFVSIGLDMKKIMIAFKGVVDSFHIQNISHARITTVDTGFDAKCTGGKEPLKFISFDVVDSKEFGYNALLMIVYRERSVSYYLKSGVIIARK
jgi:hypothetical protein